MRLKRMGCEAADGQTSPRGMSSNPLPPQAGGWILLWPEDARRYGTTSHKPGRRGIVNPHVKLANEPNESAYFESPLLAIQIGHGAGLLHFGVGEVGARNPLARVLWNFQDRTPKTLDSLGSCS